MVRGDVDRKQELMAVGKCGEASAQRGSDKNVRPTRANSRDTSGTAYPLHGLEAGVADDAADIFFGGAINSKLAVTVPPIIL